MSSMAQILRTNSLWKVVLFLSYATAFSSKNTNKRKVQVAFCPSNTTHIGWLTPSGQECVHHTRAEAESECTSFLRDNLLPFDVPVADSLGLSLTDSDDIKNNLEEDVRRKLTAVDETTETDSQVLPDGLSNGIVQDTIDLALRAKVENYWTQKIPKDIYMEYVLPYANVDEARNNWRPVLKDALDPTLKRLRMIRVKLNSEMVVEAVNKDLWSSFKQVRRGEPIVFKAGQTPRIYDPMSVILYGHASCTGLSIMLVDALRTAGVPARIAGTPAWNGKIENGNHSWVEFYSDTERKWKFMEPIVGVNKNPCKYWFCNKKHFDGKTKVYAAKWVKNQNRTYFPMSWDVSNHYVPGEDRSDEMNAICSQC